MAVQLHPTALRKDRSTNATRGNVEVKLGVI